MKFYPPHYLLALSLCMLATWFFGETSPQTLPFILIGLSLIGFGFLLAFNSISRFIKAKTGVVPFSKSTALITEGFYKYTRNPMYVGMNSFLLGLLIILNNPINFIFLVTFFFIVRNLFVIKEEVQMLETFGEEYLAYKNKVRRWL
ncbi:MAG: isoprenylcysteine carboxylmethyltransferase family protein [Gammaproteobacteria bacterium]